MKSILALDLASQTGWAYGRPGSEPQHGTIRFASVGATHEAIFCAALDWAYDKCEDIEDEGIDANTVIIVWESPLQTSFKLGRTTNNTTTVLYGLPAVIGAVAYSRGIYDIRKADTRDVRMHFLGCSPKRVKAKPMVKAQCRAMGWKVSDDNEADALATWHYMCSLIEPALALQPTPLFGTKR